MDTINIWAVLAAALSAFLLGGLWYSPVLFYKAWSRESGCDPQDGHPPQVYVVSIIFSVISAYIFARVLGPDPELTSAVLHGLVFGAGFVAASFGINYQFSNRSTTLWLIDGGYHTVQFVLYGVILGLWH